MNAPARTPAERRRDTEYRLNHDVDLWVATSSDDALPYLVPLSFDWDGKRLLISTTATSPTGQNLLSGKPVRLGLGDTRDVTMIDGDVEALDIDALTKTEADRFATRTGFDPRKSGSIYRWYRVTPRRIQAWREENELSDRDLMHEGRWLT